jgi:nucleoside-diphosphate-sugar epimerase
VITLVTGAAGNLGSRLTRHLAQSGHQARAMIHRKPLPDDLRVAPNVTVVTADLSQPGTLPAVVTGVDVVVHFAGVLFAPRPESFLPTTNTQWFSNLIDACLGAGVGKVILISFPHVEGPTSPEAPATGRLDRVPISVHATTRLEEERLLFERVRGTSTVPVVLRVGMVYGKGILMIEGARWLAQRGLLGVWREPTIIQLISTEDFLVATQAAIENPQAQGIYHLGDEKPVALQEFLDVACDEWGLRRAPRMPLWLIELAASLCEGGASLSGRPAPLTRDFIRIGRVPYWGDTRRARAELIPQLRYPSLETGRKTL